MKKLVALLSVLVLLLSFNVNAHHKSKSNLNNECREFGFDFGVSEWKWEKKQWWEWNKKEWNSDEDPFGTSVTGTHTEAEWDVGALQEFGVAGIVVKSGKDHYSVTAKDEDTGTVTSDKPIEHITFCFKPQCPAQPPPPPPQAPAAQPGK